MMRVLAILLLTTVPGLAWEAKLGRICELTYDGVNASVRVTFDPAIPEYSIAITSQRSWPNDPIFAMRFDGPRGNTISTNRQVISPDGGTVTVTDSGFGNVLNGLEFNQTATALLGDQAVTVPLDDAAPAVRAFRACASGLNA
ncbi:MAG: excinuclease ABC subunit B [Alphaproteobacteria bacterium]|nr:excinuclease ABC subunit B [Alphaproteobacteria bacterium]